MLQSTVKLENWIIAESQPKFLTTNFEGPRYFSTTRLGTTRTRRDVRTPLPIVPTRPTTNTYAISEYDRIICSMSRFQLKTDSFGPPKAHKISYGDDHAGL